MKKIIIGIIIIAIIVIGIFVFKISGSSSTSSNALNTTSQTNTNSASKNTNKNTSNNTNVSQSNKSSQTNNSQNTSSASQTNNTVGQNTSNGTVNNTNSNNNSQNAVTQNTNSNSSNNTATHNVQNNQVSNTSANSGQSGAITNKATTQSKESNTGSKNTTTQNVSQNNNSNSKSDNSSNTKHIYQQFETLGNKAYTLKVPASELRQKIYASIKDKVPNSGYIMLSQEQENIVLKGTKEKKAKLVKELGANKLLVNVSFNTLPEEGNASVIPNSYDNTTDTFYYEFGATTLGKVCESTNNWSIYNGYSTASGQLISASDYNKICNEKNFYLLNLQDQSPAFAVANQVNVG